MLSCSTIDRLQLKPSMVQHTLILNEMRGYILLFQISIPPWASLTSSSRETLTSWLPGRTSSEAVTGAMTSSVTTVTMATCLSVTSAWSLVLTMDGFLLTWLPDSCRLVGITQWKSQGCQVIMCMQFDQRCGRFCLSFSFHLIKIVSTAGIRWHMSLRAKPR